MSTVLTKSFPPEKPPAAKPALEKKRIVIIGGGFARTSRHVRKGAQEQT